MKHPNREQWIGFLYEDIDATEKAELAEHLKSCAACQSQVQTWRGAMSALDAYQIAPPATSPLQKGWFRWAAAAAIFLAGGITLGAAWQARANPDQAHVVTELRDRVEKSEAENARTRKLLADLSQTIAENRARDQEALLITARQLQATRKDLETFFIMTEANFKSAQNQLVRLANYTSPISQ